MRGDDRLHALGLGIADAYDFTVGMLSDHLQVVAHVHMLERYTSHAIIAFTPTYANLQHIGQVSSIQSIRAANGWC